MRNVAVALSVLAITASARAAGPTAVVHIDASSRVVLERVDDAGHAAFVCHAPCDLPLAIGERYRIDGDGIRPSSPFRLAGADGSRVVLTPEIAHTRSFVAGIVLTSLATLFLGGALAGLGGAVGESGSFNGVVPGLLGILSGGISLSLGIPGTLMLANNLHSSVTFSNDARSAIRPPSFTSITILSGSF